MKGIKTHSPPTCFPCTLSTQCFNVHMKLFCLSVAIRYMVQQGGCGLDIFIHPGCCGFFFPCQTFDLSAMWCFLALLMGLIQCLCLLTAQTQGQGGLSVALHLRKVQHEKAMAGKAQ